MTRVTLLSRWTSRCSYCGVRDPHLKCSACSISRYCNATCQKQDWPEHKGFCKLHKDNLERISNPKLAECVEFFSRYADEWRVPFAQWGLFATNLANRGKNYLKHHYFALLLDETTDNTRISRRTAFDVAVAGMFPNTCFLQMIPSEEYAPNEHAEFVHDFEALEKSDKNLRIVLMSNVVCTVFSVPIQHLFPASVMGWIRSPSACNYFKEVFDEEFKSSVASGKVRVATNRVKELFTFISTGEIVTYE
uniref:MYND-type domain-containing protein n=1 Tax=Mycena chlorophos TaxID=658473 RepID=A0ABQ0LR02_MYCCL|nr:predicted protein [Mycena chlorophos]